MHTVILSATTSLVEHAVKAALRRAGRAEVAAALLSGIAILRQAVAEGAGYGAEKGFDDALKQRLIARGLDLARREGPPVRIALPEPGLAFSPAHAILEETARSCLLLNATGPENEFIEAGAIAFFDALLVLLGGVPELGPFLDRIDSSVESAPDTPARSGQWMQ